MKKLILLIGLSFLFLRATSQPIYETLPSTGQIEVTLHPGPTVTAGSTHLVSFGMPFPRNTVNTISKIIITDEQGNELASDINELTRWYSLSNNSEVDGIRAILLHVNIQFDNMDPKTIRVAYGQDRTLELGSQGDPKVNWVTVANPKDEYLDNTNDPNYVELKEPAIYATFSSEWMNKCVIRTKFIPTNEVSPDFEYYDEAMINFGKTAINDVADTVEEQYKVNVLDRAPWLYDRAGCLWNVYFKTGELKWLKSAHKATQFYASFINDLGQFALTANQPNAYLPDLKYSFGGSLLIEMMLMGDLDMLDPIVDIAEFAASENLLLEDGFRFWTERHYTYWLLAAISAFEATGNSMYKNQANERAAHAFFRAQNPINGYNAEGGLIHPMGPHEGANQPDEGEEDEKGYYQPIISPWMSALLSDAIWRYYLHSEDEQALQFLVGLGENVARHCIYEVTDVHPNLDGLISPYYLASGQTEAEYLRTQIFWKPWDDNLHAPEVGGLLARAYWAQKKLDLDTSEIYPQISSMIATTKYAIEAWTRDAPERPKYRLQPPRKYNWQFGTTTDMEWLINNDPNDPLTVNEFNTLNQKFTVYPNPVNSTTIFIQSNGLNASLAGNISLLDLQGKLLTSKKISNFNTINTLDISNAAFGVYFIKITSESIQETIKIVKK